ncbi:dynein light chain roadblock-type 1 [Syngnathus typhle]
MRSSWGGRVAVQDCERRKKKTKTFVQLSIESCGLSSKTLEMAEVEETLKRILGQKGVQGLIIVNSDGIPIRSTLDNTSTVHYAGLIHQLVLKARSTIRDIDPLNDLTFLRLRSKKNEIMIAPDKDYFMIVIQNPSD